MKSGLRPTKADRRDYDFLASHKFGALPPSLPQEFNTDAGLWTPDQDRPQSFPGIPNIPALYQGCTSYTQTDLCIDEDGVLLDPMLIENVTHANANGGADIRTALKAAIQVFNRKQYFNIKASGIIDWFDACRLASYSAQPEKRSVSVGTPWFPDFEHPTDGILPIPKSFDVQLSGATWHNWAVKGWKLIGDQPYLICKSWQGPEYGDKGFVYVSRPLINLLMNISGTSAWTLSEVPAENIQTVSLSWIQNIVSLIRNLLAQKTPMPDAIAPTPTPPQKPAEQAKYLWDTPENARHSLRVICDEEGLTPIQKDTFSRVMHCESGYKNSATHDNGTSKDWGICQINDYYHIGKGKDFPSVQYVLDNPDAVVRWACRMFKAGKQTAWVCYSAGLFKNYSA